MSFTRGDLLDRVANTLGDDSSTFRTHLETSLDHMLTAMFDMHDWEFKHKSDSFNTVSGTEEYNLFTVGANDDIRSSQDVEVMYDKTNGRFLTKVDFRNIRKRFPKEDTSGQPRAYAPWGANSIFLTDEPNGIFNIKFLYVARPTLPTADDDDLEDDCDIPAYVHYLLEKLVLAEGMLFYDDSRRAAMLEEIAKLWLPNAIQADMKHLESNARFKFWEEELSANGNSFDDFLRYSWSNTGY